MNLLATLLLAPGAPVLPPQGAAPDGWLRDKDGYDVAWIDELERAVEQGAYPGLDGLVVLRRGKLLIERYFGEETRDTLHDVRSVGKTVTSAVLGLALRDGHLSSLDRPLGEFYDLEQYANPDPKKSQVTLEHLVTMTSGFDGFDFDPSSPGNEENMYPQPDWVRWTLDLPMAADRIPGESWSYFTAGVVVLGDILCRRLPGGLEVYANEQLFGPLGIQDYRWTYTPQRVPSTAGGLRIRALDLARFGQLHKNDGRWGERQVLPATWVEESLQPTHETGEDEDRYGRLWWHKDYDLSDLQVSTSYCSGNGGNKVFVFLDAPLVVVVTGSAYGEGAAHRRVDEVMTKYVLPVALD